MRLIPKQTMAMAFIPAGAYGPIVLGGPEARKVPSTVLRERAVKPGSLLLVHQVLTAVLFV